MRAILVLLVLLLGLSSDVWAGILRQGAAQVLCHRTDNREVPENTLESLALAARVGCNVIEVDIRRTADGVLVLNHDGYLEGHDELFPLYRAAEADFAEPLFTYGPPRLARLGVELLF